MWSMDKIKPDTGILMSWMKEYLGDYAISGKLDGVSGLYTTEGDEPKLYTRGNGKVGQDVSHLIPKLRLPKNKDVVIRGEFIIKKDSVNNKTLPVLREINETGKYEGGGYVYPTVDARKRSKNNVKER